MLWSVLEKIQSVLRLSQEASFKANWLKGSSALLNVGCALKCEGLFYLLKDLTALGLCCIEIQNW